MKILLISTYPTFPVGLRYITSFLEGFGHEVFLKQLYPPNQQKVIRAIEEIKPSLVGLTCYTPEILEVLGVARLIKQFSPETKIVLGNIHATVCYRKILEEFFFIDYVVLGEGEVPMKELLEHLAGKSSIDEVHNIAYRNNDKIIRTKEQRMFPRLDDLSDFPQRPMSKDLFTHHYHILRYRRYSYISARKASKLQITPIFTSRGCSYDCDYCSESCMSRHRWRAHSPEKVIDSIEKIHKTYGISRFGFQDPLFTFDKERVKRICAEIEKRGLKIKWGFETHSNHIDEELVYAIKRAGCIMFAIGIDCLTNNAMQTHRNVTVDYEHLAKVIKLAKALKMIVKINIIIGWPNTSFQDLFRAIQHIKKLKPTHLSINFLKLMPGTKLYNKAVEEGLIDDNYWLNNKNPSFYQGVYWGRKPNIKDFFWLKLQKIIMSVMYVIYCRHIHGLMYLITYTTESWLGEFTKYIRKYFPVRK